MFRAFFMPFFAGREHFGALRIFWELDCDFVNLHGVDNKTRSRLISRGKLVALNDIWENYSQGEAKKYYEEGYGKEIAKLNKMEDGNVYWTSGVTVGDYHGEPWSCFVMPMIRKDWVDKLGLEMPTTTDELFDVLKAFQDQDVNGNGERDEVASVELNSFGNGIAQFFGLGREYCYVDYYTGEIRSPWYDDTVKDYITYMQKLNEAGLLETAGQGDEKKAENKISLINSWWIEAWEEPQVNVPEGEAAPYFCGILCQGVDGVDPVISREGGVQKTSCDFAVTDQADPEAIGILLDYLSSDKYRVLSEFGIEGYTFETGEDGVLRKMAEGNNSGNSEVEIMSKVPALWVNDSIFPRVDIINREQELTTGANAGLTMGYEENGFIEKAQMIRNVYENEEDYHYTVLNTQTSIAMATEEENEILNDLTSDFETYSEELLTKLILGQESLDNWDKYIEELKSLGLDELMAVMQARYDRTQE